MGLRSQLIDPRSSERRPRRAAYALPTLFTAGNIFLGYLSILRAFRGAMAAAAGSGGAPEHSQSPPKPSSPPLFSTASTAASPA